MAKDGLNQVGYQETDHEDRSNIKTIVFQDYPEAEMADRVDAVDTVTCPERTRRHKRRCIPGGTYKAHADYDWTGMIERVEVLDGIPNQPSQFQKAMIYEWKCNPVSDAGHNRLTTSVERTKQLIEIQTPQPAQIFYAAGERCGQGGAAANT